MTRISKILFASAICASVFPAVAMAAPVSVSSFGTFSGLSSCDTTGSDANCRITSSSNGSNTQVQWGSDRSWDSFHNPSTLTAVDLASNVSAASNNVNIAQITWHNSATLSDSDLTSFGVNYNLSITIGSATDGNTFALTIQNPVNPPGDIIGAFTLGDLSGLSFTTAGWTIDQLHYAADGGTTFGGACGANKWCNPEGNTGNLYIQARFTPNTPVTPVPEPVTLSLFGAGLVGAAALRRRRKVAKA